MYALGINQNICITSYSPVGYWRNDTILPTPLPFYPREGANICLEPSISYPSSIDIIWLPVAGATEYVLEWADNVSFDGPSLRAVITSNTNYALQKDVDIRIGQQIYWRVFARDGIGGLSLKSAPRMIKYECPAATLEKNPAENVDRCTNFDIKLKIHGDDYMKCCESKMWSVEFSYTGKDQLGNQLLSIQSIDWTISASGSSTKPQIIDETDDYVIVEACGATKEDSQIFEIEIRVTFVDLTTSTTFDCTEQKKVFLDCHSGVGEQPWAKAIKYDYLLSVPKHFYSPYSYEPYVRGVFEHSYCYCDMLVVAGPVFKVPIPVPVCPENYIQTECCNCAPPWIPFQIETEFGLVGGTMVWNGNKWTFTDNRTSTANMCSSAQLTVELECDGSEFTLSATEICSVPCTGTICAGRSFRNDTVTLEFESKVCASSEPISSGIIALNRKELEGQWDSNNIAACDDDCIYYVQLRLEQDPPKIYVRKFCFNDGDPIDEVLNPDGLFDNIDCGPTKVTMTLALSDTSSPPATCCLDFTVTASLCGSGTTRILEVQNPDDETFLFSDCKKPDGSLLVMWTDPDNEEAPPVGGTINLGGALPLDAGCLCQADYYSPIKVERYGLEARVNIPLGCGLKSEHGNLTLDPFPIAKLIKYLTGYLDASGIYCNPAITEPQINPCYGYCLWQWNYDVYSWYKISSSCAIDPNPPTTTTTCDPDSCIEDCLVRQYICGTFLPPDEPTDILGACCFWTGKYDKSGERELDCLEVSELNCELILEGKWYIGKKCDEANCSNTKEPPLLDSDCNCIPPDFCPSEEFDDKFTITNCTILDVEGSVCNTTSPPTTPPPPPPDPPCVCPTTREPCIDYGCCWIVLPRANGGWGWRLVENECIGYSHCLPCPEPDLPPTPCAIANTDCVHPPSPPPPEPPECSGKCLWSSIPSNPGGIGGGCELINEGPFSWVLIDFNCSSTILNCNCKAPSVPPQGICVNTVTNCGRPTTTQDPCKQWIIDNCGTTPIPVGACCFDDGCEDDVPENECTEQGGIFQGPYTLCENIQCFTTPPATTSPPTTSGPCSLGCTWQWSAGDWEKINDSCDPSCPCFEPIFPGLDNTVIKTDCIGGTTTTTSTTTTTTTTSTTLPPIGACCYIDISQNDPNCFPVVTPIVVCAELTEAECLDMYQGVWYSDKDCSPSPCYKCTTTTTTLPPTTTLSPTGACCIGNSCVNNLTEKACLELGGLYEGNGTLCTSVSCSNCTGDCLYDWNGIGWVLVPESPCDCMCFPPATTPAPGPVINPYPGSCLAI